MNWLRYYDVHTIEDKKVRQYLFCVSWSVFSNLFTFDFNITICCDLPLHPSPLMACSTLTPVCIIIEKLISNHDIRYMHLFDRTIPSPSSFSSIVFIFFCSSCDCKYFLLVSSIWWLASLSDFFKSASSAVVYDNTHELKFPASVFFLILKRINWLRIK